jgi:hypothetical protein
LSSAAETREPTAMRAMQSGWSPRMVAAGKDVVHQHAADRAARHSRDVEQFHGLLLGAQRCGLDREAPRDHALAAEHDEIELEALESRRGRIVEHEIGAAALVLVLEFVEFDVDLLRDRLRLRPGALRNDKRGGADQDRSENSVATQHFVHSTIPSGRGGVPGRLRASTVLQVRVNLNMFRAAMRCVNRRASAISSTFPIN